MYFKTGFLSIYLFLLSPLLFSQFGGSSTYAFLDLPCSARVVALGGNLMCVKDNDLNVAIFNPSLLSDSMDNNVALSYSNHFAKVNYGYASYAKHIHNFGNISAGILYLDYGKFQYADVYGYTDFTNSQFTAGEMCFNLAYSRHILDSNFTIGVSLKTIYSHLEGYYSIGSALDIGGTYFNAKRNLTISGLILNYGKEWRPYVDGSHESLPFQIQFGISKKPRHIPLRLSLIYEHLEHWNLVYDSPLYPTTTTDPISGETVTKNKYKVAADKLMRHVIIGGEFIITKNIYLRIGYNYRRSKELQVPEKKALNGFSAGFGFRINKFHFSYGRALYHLAGATNTFTISFDINSFYHRATF